MLGVDLLTKTVAMVAVAAYSAIAAGVTVYSTIEIGPNLLAAITSIVGVVVFIIQLKLGKNVTQARETASQAIGTAVEAKDTAVEAKDTAEHAEKIVDRRKGDV